MRAIRGPIPRNRICSVKVLAPTLTQIAIFGQLVYTGPDPFTYWFETGISGIVLKPLNLPQGDLRGVRALIKNSGNTPLSRLAIEKEPDNVPYASHYLHLGNYIDRDLHQHPSHYLYLDLPSR